MRVHSMLPFAILAVASVAQAGSLPEMTMSHPDTAAGHYDFGSEIGKRFAGNISARILANTAMQDTVLPYLQTATGKATLASLLDRHNKTYPMYVLEIQGMAEGSNIPFETLFANNLMQELTLLAGSSKTVDHCSDYVVVSGVGGFISHNEDADLSDKGHTFLLKITWQSARPRSFTAYTYMGDLPSGAFGYVPGQFAFTLNKVPPKAAMAGQGFGRGFVSRAVLDAATFAEALAVASKTPNIAGHNYQILPTPLGRAAAPAGWWIANVETYHDGAAGVENVTAAVGSYFHANSYKILDAPQFSDPGSIARMNRAAQLPAPTDLPSALRVLGDTYNTSYPVYHSGAPGDISGLVTLNSVVFDMSGTWRIFAGNPTQQAEIYSGSLWD
ncbi:hypothetical protein DIPPA_01450 [Diplonema papillatum]|nr:hypothetical protein DIPPA_01450 [Diplonema papillatum]